MAVIACKKDLLQGKLANHKKLVERFNSVRYLHVLRCYNSAVDTLATRALETNSGKVEKVKHD